MDKWEKKTDNCCYWYVCPHCGEETPHNKWGHLYFSNFCPGCGKPLLYPKIEEGY